MFAAKDALLTRPSGGYVIPRSLRFRSSASAYLNRTFGTPTANLTWTYSVWIKRGKLSAAQEIFSCAADNDIYFGSSDTVSFFKNGVGVVATSTQVFRDPSAYGHFVFNSNGTTVNGYYNGSTTAFISYTGTLPNFNSAAIHTIAKAYAGTQYLDGYMAETYFVDGQALSPTSFGATNATTGVWAPIKYAGTYGANGFHLDFNSYATTAALGTDTSGNGNTWTVNNISVTAGATYDSMIDVPTVGTTGSNYCVFNPLDNVSSSNALTEGNLKVGNAAAAHYGSRGTMALPTSGKFYWESTLGTTIGASNAGSMCGVATAAAALNIYPNGTTGTYTFYSSGAPAIIANGVLGASLSPAPTLNAGALIQTAYDAATGKVWLGVANVWYQSSGAVGGDPAAGTGQTATCSGTVYPYCELYSNSAQFNFGQRPFTYTPPTGYSALNTYNLPTPTILKGNTVMDATLYTGTGASLSVTNAAGFQPDLVWVKSRSAATDHAWYDSVRGVQKQIESNTTTAETTETTGLTAFGSTGFTVGALAQMNTSAATYVGWQWKGSGTTVSNTTGSITSTVCVNPTAGFSVLTYTGTGVAATIGHSLGVAPSLIIVKPRSAAGDWISYTNPTGAGNFLLLNTTAASAASATKWNNTTPTSSVFSVGVDLTTNTLTTTYVAYCFAPIAGYSAFGSYTGNGSTDGPFVFTGFRPRWLMVKQTAIGNWFILDAARNAYNVTNTRLIAEGTVADDTGSAYDVDFLSNGFKLRSTSNVNVSAAYIYIAFAESPFKNSLAR